MKTEREREKRRGDIKQEKGKVRNEGKRNEAKTINK